MSKLVIGGKDEGRIKGFVEYNNVEYPFSYEDWILDMYPQNKDVWRDDSVELLKNIGGVVEVGKFINQICVVGKTSTGKNIRFIVSEQYSNENGFLSFNVYSVYIFEGENSKICSKTVGGKKKLYRESTPNKIRGIILKGREIDYYYNPANAFYSILSQDEEGKIDFRLGLSGKKEEDCGVVTLGNTEFKIYLRSIATAHGAVPTPVTSHSELIVESLSESDLNDVETIYYAIRDCLAYLCRRLNISFDEIEIFDFSPEGKRRVFGRYYLWLDIDMSERHVQASKRIIDHTFINGRLGNLLQQFLDGKMYINNLPNTVAQSNQYGPDRIIFNFVAFEREYANLYPETATRSEEYLEVKNCVLDSINSLINKLTGKKKKYAKGFHRTIEKSENSFGARLEQAIRNHEGALTPFLIQNYGREYTEKIEGICNRMNQMRNDSAHGNIDVEFSEEHFGDFAILECLIYAMRLRAIGLDYLSIQRAICKLMNYNIYIPDAE